MTNEIIHECCGKPESQCHCLEDEMHIKNIKDYPYPNVQRGRPDKSEYIRGEKDDS